MSDAARAAENDETADIGCPNCGSTSPGVTTRGPGEHRTTCCGENVADWSPVWRRR